MIVTIPCPSAPFPIGGVKVCYQIANGLSRRGHDVHLVHGPYFANRIEAIDDIWWFRFEDTITHHLDRGPAWELIDQSEREHLWPDADVVFGPRSRPELGLPVHLIQGLNMLSGETEHRAFHDPGLKVAIARWLVDAALQAGVPATDVVYVPNGIDHDRFRVRTPVTERGPVVAVLHSAHPSKAWEVGLEVLEQVLRRVPGTEVVAFGTARPQAIPDWMTFWFDPTPDQLTTEIYDRARIILQPSHYEGFGLTAVEAMASGCALVTTDNGGSHDYAIDGETALIAPPRDVDLLAAHTVRLLEDPDLCVRLANAGVAHTEQFDWDRSTEQLERHLEHYLADPTPAFRTTSRPSR